MVYSYELEQHLLAGLIKHPESYPLIAAFITKDDFFSQNSAVNKTIFCVLRQSLEASEILDEVLLSQRVKSLGMSFEDNINIGDYIKALSMRQISKEGVLKTAKELKKITVRREIHDASIDVAKNMKSISASSTYDQIVSEADKIYNEKINLYEIGSNNPENLFDDMEDWIEDRGNNPIDEFGLMGPHKRINECYGSLLRPGNITVVVARAGVGKTQFCMDFCTKVSAINNNVPILHFDNGEMSKEELIVRPTSEAIIWSTYKNWIQSYRDLPILINQWANVVRWEMRTRLFLRTAEFLWQEGHTAHATKEEAIKETKLINDIYSDFAEKFMAMPVVKGYKSESERFAGAEETLCIEALMQDGKALQAGTSHFLGQNFAKAFDVKYADKSGKLEYVWATSWGVSTRLMGALIMSHSDDVGLVLPPLLAPIQIIIIPLIKSKDDPKKIIDKTDELFNSLKSNGIRVKIDNRENMSLGFKLNDSEVKGIPMRVVIGEKEIENNQFEIFYRYNLKKVSTEYENLLELLSSSISSVQSEMISESKKRLKKNTHEVNSYDEFKDLISNQRGFVIAGWDGTKETEEAIKIETKATIRCIPESVEPKGVTCIYSGKPARYKVIFSKSY